MNISKDDLFRSVRQQQAIVAIDCAISRNGKGYKNEVIKKDVFEYIFDCMSHWKTCLIGNIVIAVRFTPAKRLFNQVKFIKPPLPYIAL